MANSLTSLMTIDEMKQVAVKLLRYSRIHFSCEEAMMREANYPELKNHHELHNSLEHRLADCMETVFTAGGDLFQLQKFVYDWLIDHILHQDKLFFDFLNSQKAVTSENGVKLNLFD